MYFRRQAFRCQQLPDNLTALTALKKLSLEYLDISSLPDGFGSLTGLEELKAHKCKSLDSLPDSFCNLNCLQKLHVTNFDFHGLENLPALWEVDKFARPATAHE
jgi:Leucine-rich repeat (LRR) protein